MDLEQKYLHLLQVLHIGPHEIVLHHLFVAVDFVLLELVVSFVLLLVALQYVVVQQSFVVFVAQLLPLDV
ncbi:hypothetical protein [Priestia megaterium]|uniref:hypothetical protein n=1 Tax=Priestia megaterium TaxID=1404 RepID=UPI002E20084A|nr:hypothetical protein [Priestia megaterium]